jgi:hypothetical protein
MADSIKVSRIVDGSYEAEPNHPAWVTEAFANEDFLIVNTTVRLKVAKDEVYATYRDTITVDENGKFGVVRAESGVL